MALLVEHYLNILFTFKIYEIVFHLLWSVVGQFFFLLLLIFKQTDITTRWIRKQAQVEGLFPGSKFFQLLLQTCFNQSLNDQRKITQSLQ